MTETTHPEIVPVRNTWLIWVVPLVALLVGGYLLYRDFSERGPLIRATFSDGSGLEAGKTKVLSRGVIVGEVEGIRLLQDEEAVEVEIRLDASASGMAREGTRIWIVRPEISSRGISGLEALVSGAYLQVDPGEGRPVRTFKGLEDAPTQFAQGRRFVLTSPSAKSMHPGVPVLFRGIEVGLVDAVTLAKDATGVRLEVLMEAPYHRLVREGSVFWDSSGVNMRVGLLGARIQTGSLQSMVSGSVSLAVSPEAAGNPEAAEGTEFPLYSETKDIWLEWSVPVDLGQAVNPPGKNP